MEKMTNVKAMELAIALANGNDELVEKLGKIKASFEKKNSTERKPSATQIANKGLRDAIVTYLANGESHTISELMKLVPELADMSNQKVSALVRGLVDEKLLIREEIKRKAYFKLA